MNSRYRVALAVVCLALLGLMTPSALRADNLVANGGFETGDLTGWTQTSFSGSLFGIGTNGSGPHSGYYAADFGAMNNNYDTISQTLATSNGTGYIVSFWLANSSGDGGGGTDFQVLWNGTSLDDIAITAAFGYTEYTFYVMGTGSDTLSFEGYNGPGWTSLDDVSVDVTPEPSSIYLLGTALLVMCGLVMRRKGIA
jgi:hypothetical protein